MAIQVSEEEWQQQYLSGGLKIPSKVKNLMGTKHNRLSVLGFAYVNIGAYWVCGCDCGIKCVIRGSNLIDNRVKSCGCLRAEIIDDPWGTHHQSHSRTYATWRSMHNRCGNSKVNGYENYGGRGITVCNEWGTFEQFHSDMGDRPENTTIERIDTEKGYCPENCKWATHKEQGRNKRNSIKLTARGETKHVNDWADISGVKAPTIIHRIKRLGWGVEDAIFTPASSFQRLITHRGETKNATDWALLCNVTKKTIINRLNKGLTPAEILKEIN